MTIIIVCIKSQLGWLNLAHLPILHRRDCQTMSCHNTLAWGRNRRLWRERH